MTAARNVLVLSVASGLTMIANSTLIAEAALVGHMLAENKAWATLPIGMQQLGVMLTTFPASFLMARIGRRAGFTIGAAFGAVGTSVAAYAIVIGSFWLFCAGMALNGVYSGFSQFYRFAAVDGASGPWKAKAISYVLAGGLAAALLGPELAKHSKDWLSPFVFAGSFAALTGFAILALLLLQFVDIPRPAERVSHSAGRKLSEIARQPAFVVAALAGMISYGAMSLVMNATPLAMMACNHPFESTAFVIQWHIVAMFAPSFVTGSLIVKFGLLRIMGVGAAALALCIAINATGAIDVAAFWVSLVLLGLGWNFLYVGASTMITETYRPEERAKVQAANEFLVFGSVALAAIVAGGLLHGLGWVGVNLVAAPFVVLAALALVWLARRRTAATA